MRQNYIFKSNSVKKEAYLFSSNGFFYTPYKQNGISYFTFGKNDIIHVTYDP